MQRIYDYEDFILERMINETVLFFSPEIRGVLNTIMDDSNLDGEIRRMAIELLAKEVVDIDMDVTFVDKSDKLGYLTHSRENAVKKIADQSGENLSLNDMTINRSDDLWIRDIKGEGPGIWNDKKRGEVKISKLVNKLIDKKYTEAQREIFVNLIKSKLSEKTKFIVVKEEDIIKYYNKENYAEEKGTLGNSCMRSKSNDIFDIYVKNPEKCSLLVLVNEEDKVLGRALLWELDFCTNEEIKKFMDRIYTANDYDVNKFKAWAIENKYAYKYKNTFSDVKEVIWNRETISVDMRVDLNKIDYYSFPYLDTFKLYSPDNHSLHNINTNIDDSNYAGYYILTATDGGRYVINENTDDEDDEEDHEGQVWSDYQGEWIDEDDAVYIDHVGHVHSEDAVYIDVGNRRNHGWHLTDSDNICWSDHINAYIHEDDAAWSNVLNTYLLSNETYITVTDIDTDGEPSGTDNYPEDSEDVVSKSNFESKKWYDILSQEWSGWYDCGAILVDLIEYDYSDEPIISQFSFKTHKVENKNEFYLDIDAYVLGIKIERNPERSEHRMECAFEYFDRNDMEDILKKCKSKIKELEHLIKRQTVIDFKNYTKEEYIGHLNQRLSEIEARIDEINDYKSNFYKE